MSANSEDKAPGTRLAWTGKWPRLPTSTPPMTVPHNGAPVPAPTTGAAVSALRAMGLRASSARRLVLEALFAAEEPVSAERIAGGLEGRVPPSDLASVYRNLETLEAVGLVRHFHLGHGAGRYTLAGRPREYLVCESCRSIRSVDPHELDGLRKLLRARFGLDPTFSHFPILGRCRRCRADGEAGEEPT